MLISSRRLGVGVLATAAALGLLVLTVPVLLAGAASVHAGTWSTTGFEDLLVQLCALAASLAAVCWWWGTLRLVAAVRPGAVGPDRVAEVDLPTPAGLPAPLRRLVLLACGVALVAGPVSPALAAGGGTDPLDPLAALVLPAATGDRPAQGPGGLPLPDRVSGEIDGRSAHGGRTGPDTTPAPAPEPATRGARVVQVVQVVDGDSLWRIAEAQLTGSGAEPTDAAIAERWQRIYHANAAEIGPDPDVIVPGQRLDLGA